MTDTLTADHGWQPIESAPRNGLPFLALGQYDYHGDPIATTYVNIVEYSHDELLPWADDEGLHPEDFYTHWQPLPVAPEQEKP